MTRAGRKKPYTRAGIKRLKCVRCGDQGSLFFENMVRLIEDYE